MENGLVDTFLENLSSASFDMRTRARQVKRSISLSISKNGYGCDKHSMAKFIDF
jgi:hypothetical protein